MRLAVLALCGCNAVFGVHDTKRGDAALAFFDAPTDAPFACPPLGTAPRFTGALRQVLPQDCTDYTISVAAGLAVASCGADIADGPIDMALTTIIPNAATVELIRPRLSPEGDAILMYTYGATQQYVEYRGNAGIWTQGAVLPFPSSGAEISTPTRSPNRHVLVYEGDGELHEFADQGGNVWKDTATHTELGPGFPVGPYLSPDGLRVMFSRSTPQGEQRALYADRDALDQPFGTLVPLEGVPGASDLFMTEDCSRIYMSGLQSVFYVQQL